jgi:hypothetical protein
MRTKRFLVVGAAVVLCWAGAAQAEQYPPGPGGAYPDTLIKVDYIQNPAATPHPVAPDTVWGIGGIIIGFDPIASGFAIYIQNSQGGPYSGVDVFTGAANYIGNFIPNLAIGDSIMAYGRLDEFEGETELRGFANSAFSDPLPAVRRISTGNPLPPFHRTTTNELNELPSNLAAEQWEGTLVRIKDKLIVVRNSDTGGLDNSSAFLAVDKTLCPPGTVGPCDSVFVDGSTLASPSVLPPAVGALVDSVQGIFGHRTRGYRIQLRSGSDMFGTFPPGLQDAYSIYPDTVRLIFDRALTQASAENELNYTLSSTLGPPDVAIRQVQQNIVHLKVTNGLAACDPEGISANGLVSLSDGATMTVAGTRNFRNGICPISSIQAADPDSLLGTPCQDRSLYAGPGSAPGGRITTRGVCTAVYGTNYFIQTAAGGVRSGLLVFAPTTALVRGRQYVIAGAIQEFFTETEMVGTVYIRNEGVVAEPAAVVQTVAVVRDTVCDTPPPTDTGEDYEHMKVQVVDVKTTWEGTPAGPGAQFRVAGPYPSNPDTILIDNNIFRTFDPTVGRYVTVTGVLDLSFGTWRIQPRGNTDITTHPTLSVGDPDPGAISFGVSPNPARSAYVTFSLPKRDRVTIGIYDLAGRRRTVLVDGEYPAGTHTLEWNGTDSEGKSVGSGVYFYKLKVGDQTFSRRAVLLN